MERSGMWGYKDDTDNGVLKGRPNMYCIVNHHLRFVSPFQGFNWIVPVRNPTFRSAPCGAEIRRPCRTPLPIPFRKPHIPLCAKRGYDSGLSRLQRISALSLPR
ncbi:hypothetical protein Barb4_02322 [Bacteroidales bacterium Barb4]|nr:hypothetical protein Barb4_02322 [Bacteroidales bacterium Barb4]